MITKTTGVDYQELFEQIKAKSNNTLVIENLESFFGNIEQIKALDKKFLRLPLDEPMFEIDANTRKISIPSDFSSNGLSVQGDHLAETIFFKINRYFDFIDLSKMDIYVNWKMNSESFGSTKADFIKSTDIEPGYIIFGWPVSKDLTGKSGSLSFAVQFCKKDTQSGDYEYNFNTLVSTIAIKDGLVLNNPTVVSLSDDILSILTDSPFGSGEAAVDAAVWLTGDGKGLVPGSIDGAFVNVVNMPTSFVEGSDTTPTSSAVNLFAIAAAGSDAEIQYIPGSGITGEVVAVEVGESESKINNIIYYNQDKSRASLANINAWFAPLGSGETDKSARTKIYKLAYKVIADEKKMYTISANGFKENTSGVKIGSGVAVNSNIVSIPSAKAPAAILSAEAQSASDGYVLDSNFAAKGSDLTASISNLTADEKGAFQIKWYKGSELVETSGWTSLADGTAENVYEANDAGSYKVVISNFKNNESVNSEDSNVIVVDDLVSAISSIVLKRGTSVLSTDQSVTIDSSSRNNKTANIAVVVDDGSNTSGLSYGWEKAASIYDIDGNRIDDALVGWQPIFDDDMDDSSLKIGVTGWYRVKVTRSGNGNKFIKYSEPIQVVDNPSNT